MTPEQLEGNKMIAEFMGIKWTIQDKVRYPNDNHDYKIELQPHFCLVKYGQKNFLYGVIELQYHTSWDWLMPVVEKIKSLVMKKAFDRTSAKLHININIQLMSVDIGNVYSAVIQFITWFNQQNKEA